MDGLVYMIVVGIIAGFLAGQIWKGRGFGLVADLIIGVIGAVLGGWLFGILGIWPGGGIVGSIIVATIGALLLLFIIKQIKKA